MPRVPLTVPLLLLCVSAAHGEPLLPPGTQMDQKPRPLLAKELTRERDALSSEPLREPSHWRRIHLRKGAGFEVQRKLQLGEREMVVAVKGPLMKRKRLGLALEVRF